MLFYRSKHDIYPLVDIITVFLERAGRRSQFENTIHYKVVVQLKHGIQLKVLEARNRLKASGKANSVRKFLNIPGELQLRDFSVDE